MPTIKLPQAGKIAQSGTVRRWLKQPGETVAKGDVLVEIETEEGLLQVEAPTAGKLGQVLLAVGQTGPVLAPLAVIDEIAASAGTVAKGGQATSRGATMATGKGPVAVPAGKVIPILMPKAGQSMEEGTILEWRVKVGDTIKQGDVIFEIETDKATMEVEATDAGKLARIVVQKGEMLPVLQPVAYLADSDADVEAYIAASGLQAGRQGDNQTGSNDSRGEETATATAALAGKLPVAPSVADSGRVKASPAARKVAAERGVDLRAVGMGSGPGGRILSGDVPASAAAAGPLRRRMSQMRRAIARNLTLSKQTIPHFYVRLTIDAAPMVAFYQTQKAAYPCSINDVIVMACARAMKEFPAFRSRIEGDEIVESPSANIGIAVGLDEGLVVPVVMAADRLSLQQIGSETKRLAQAARGGKIEGMGQGCFTITNLGMFGTEEFAAIINPPEAGILAVGATREAVIVKDGAMRAGKVMTMTLSADHRVVDGMLAARFLGKVKELLESPSQLA